MRIPGFTAEYGLVKPCKDSCNANAASQLRESSITGGYPWQAVALANSVETLRFPREQIAALGSNTQATSISRKAWQPESDARAALLWHLVCGLKTPFLYERSISIRRAEIFPNRFLLSVSKNNLGHKYHQKTISIWHRLGVPMTLQNVAESFLQAATFLGFGYEEGQRSHLYKIYIQMEMPPDHSIDSAPFLLFIGFKWDDNEPSRAMITRYYCHPSSSVLGLLRRIKVLYGKDYKGKSFDIARGILSLADQSIGQGAMHYLEATEDFNSRRSFDVSLYDARLTLSQLNPILNIMCHHFSVPIEQLDTILSPNQSKVVTHLSGGFHRAGEDYFCVYYGAEDRNGC